MSKNHVSLEIACFSTDSAVVASEAGAHRIELCGGPSSSGGLTPLLTDLQYVKEKVDIPVHVMIRPRAGNFVYSEDEIGSMKASMTELKEWADGFVFGVLNEVDELDIAWCKELLSVAGDKPCVFHRAVDQVRDGGAVYDLINRLGFKGVLTGGHQSTAAESVPFLTEVTAQHKSSGLNIIIGGGVRASNIGTLLRCTDARWYHSAALVNGGAVASSDEIKEMLKIIDEADVS